jgi:hypothetical protein
MKTVIRKREVRKSGDQVVREKLKAANEFLKKTDLGIIYKSQGEQNPQKG